MGCPDVPLEGTIILEVYVPPLSHRCTVSSGLNFCLLWVATDMAVESEEQEVASDLLEALPSALM